MTEIETRAALSAKTIAVLNESCEVVAELANGGCRIIGLTVNNQESSIQIDRDSQFSFKGGLRREINGWTHMTKLVRPGVYVTACFQSAAPIQTVIEE